MSSCRRAVLLKGRWVVEEDEDVSLVGAPKVEELGVVEDGLLEEEKGLEPPGCGRVQLEAPQ